MSLNRARGVGRRGLALDLAAALFLGVVAAVAIGPGLRPGRTVLPLDVLGLFEPWRLDHPGTANPELGDALLQFSNRTHLGAALAQGQVPLWDPTIMAGHPRAGDTHASPFSPTPWP